MEMYTTQINDSSIASRVVDYIKFPCCVGVIAIAEINEALNSGDPEKTLATLLLPTAKLQGVNPVTGKHYHDLLLTTKDLICKVT